MAEQEEKKVTVKKTAAKSTTTKTAAKTTAAKKTTATKKTAAPKAESVEVVAEKKAPVKKAKAVKAKGNGNKVAAVVSRVEVDFKNRVIPEMMKKFNYSSVMEVPHLEKIIINMGVGEAASDSKFLEQAINDLTLIAGQRPVKTKAKKSVANFKLREGQDIGCKVTLRSLRMYDFFDKLITIALPRVRDFRGVSKNAFDGRGNYALGVKEQLIFPEIDYDKIAKIRGMDIIIVTSAKTDKEAYALLELLGMPFRR